MDSNETALAADYAAAGFGGALRPGARPLLILIDFARAYFDPESPLCAGVEDARASAARLADAARAAGLPVLFTRVEYGPEGEGGGIFWHKIAALKVFVRGNPMGDFTAELAPMPGDRVVTKHFPSAFFGTGLAEQLHAEGVDTLIITGLSTSGCVRATAVDALCHGFVPLVVRDAVGDRDAAVHAANLFDLAAKTAEVIGEAQALAYIGQIAVRNA
ncbi:isochorismatase family protein [Sandarakinorhabdus sp.]|uniref:isochorismatase family protein n=1 Tax=Sandarakinorhabdus sp. TaxID=1916663 RepID=UPI00286E5CD6|nr:isochorismatase family protein [Sandarakinorhabdus sp.]